MQVSVKSLTIKILARALTLVGALVFFISCENDIQKVNELTAQNDTAIMKAKEVEMTYSLKGIVKVRMRAPELKRFEKEPGKSILEFPSGLDMYFYDSTGVITSQIKAKYSIYNEYNGIWEAKNDVEAINDKGEKLNTEYLVWDREKEKISSNQFVKVTTLTDIYYGDGFESDQSFNQWEVFNIRGLISLESEKGK
jgi:LPS export ABC transporter protein LptC